MSAVPFLAAAGTAFLAVAACEALAALLCRREPPWIEERLAGAALARRRFRDGWMLQPTFAWGAALALAALWFAQRAGSGDPAAGPPLLAVAAATAALAGVVQWRGVLGGRSERHLAATLAAGAVGVLAGVAIPFTDFGMGAPVSLGPALSLLLTLLWLFLVVSVVELGALVPLLAPLLGGALALLSWRFGGGPQTFASFALAGVIAGGLAGHAAASLLFRGGRFLSKADVLALGYLAGSLTVMTFLKSLAFVAVILPAAFAALALAVLGAAAFERSLLLRPTPRG